MTATLIKIAVVVGIALFLVWFFRREKGIAEALCTVGITPSPGEVECGLDRKPRYRPANEPNAVWNPQVGEWITQSGPPSPFGTTPPSSPGQLPTSPTSPVVPLPSTPGPGTTPVPPGGGIDMGGTPMGMFPWAMHTVGPDPDPDRPGWFVLSPEMGAIRRQDLIDFLQDGATLWPTDYRDSARAWEPLPDARNLLVACPADVGRPLRVAHPTRAGLHDVPWTVFAPSLPSWDPRSSLTDPAPQSWRNMVRARVGLCIMADQADAYMDDVVLHPQQMRSLQLLTPFEFEADSRSHAQDRNQLLAGSSRSGDYASTQRWIDHGLLIMGSLSTQFIQWLQALADRMESDPQGPFHLLNSWGTTMQGPVHGPGPLARGMADAAGIPLVPRGPWRLGLRIWMAETLSGIGPQAAVQGVVNLDSGYLQARDRLDTLFGRAWGLPYSDVRQALYHVMAPHYLDMLQFVAAAGSDSRGLDYRATLAARTVLPQTPPYSFRMS